MEPNLAQQHDDVYAAVFSLVGQKPNETYEELAKVLPAIKDSDPAELKELEARKALRDMMKPPVDPLRLEYDRAVAEEDADDLSTEDGEWLDFSKKDDDAQELDENGIPVVKLSRASSSFILDGPGDVKVDNFTPEVDLLADEEREEPAARAGAGEPQERVVRGVAAATAAGTTHTTYVPSAISRAKRQSGAGGASASASGTHTTATTATTDGASASEVRGSGPATAPAASPSATAPAETTAAAPPVITLEDEIRAMQGRPGALSSATPTSPSRARQNPQSRPQDDDDDDDDAPEVVPEPSGPLLPPGGGRRRSGSGHENGSGSALTTAPGAVLGDDGSTAMRMRSGLGADDGTAPSLPGTCQDTRGEDTLWTMMQGVNGRALVEHLGLAVPEDAEGEGQRAAAGETAGQQPQNGAGVAPALVNGHLHHDDSPGEGPPRGQLEDAAHVNSADGVANRTHGASVSAAGAATTDTVRAAQPADASNGGPTATPDGGHSASMVTATGHRPQPSTQLQPVVSTSSEGPTFEAVESFRLDPDFDYDNVTLTVREFPYSLLNFPVRR